MPTSNSPPKTYLIAGITPYFLERGVLWFQENHEAIFKKARSDQWWRDHTLFLEPGTRHLPSPFLRKLSDMGYVKAGHAEHRGEFATRGGIVDVFPINFDYPIRIEFSGNIVENVFPVILTAEPKPLKISSPKDATDYEKLWLSSLRPGDYLVHIDHGIGVFRDFTADGGTDEYGETDETVQLDERSNLPTSPSRAIHQVKRSNISYYILEYAPPRRGGMPDRLLVPRAQAKKPA